jgi:hypothetical protein
LEGGGLLGFLQWYDIFGLYAEEFVMVCLSGRENRKGEKERNGEQFIHRESEVWFHDIRGESVNLKW